jgi:two-component system chemotaxis response regulator CheB
MHGDSGHIQGHDTIVIGGSSGGLSALQQVVRGLPSDLPAAVFIVVHMGMRSHLADVLGRHSALPLAPAETGAPIRPGTITVAQPGVHLLIHDDHVLLRRGPRENLARPALDPLFRTAACSRGGRVVGVVLSGSLNDGTAGLSAIKRCGGLAVVQDPADAAVPAMPLSALRHVNVDYTVPAAQIGATLVQLAAQPAAITPEIPLDLRLEAMIATQEIASMELEDKLGKLSPFTCPECNGALWEVGDDTMLRFRCHVGHAFTAETILSARSADVDKMIETLLRSHVERAALARRLADKERGLKNTSLATQFEARAQEYDQDAEVMRRLARHQWGGPASADGGAEGEFLRNESAETHEP